MLLLSLLSLLWSVLQEGLTYVHSSMHVGICNLLCSVLPAFARSHFPKQLGCGKHTSSWVQDKPTLGLVESKSRPKRSLLHQLQNSAQNCECCFENHSVGSPTVCPPLSLFIIKEVTLYLPAIGITIGYILYHATATILSLVVII